MNLRYKMILKVYSFIRQKPSTSEHILIPFTGAQAEAVEGDCGDHREGGGPGEGDLVWASCDGEVVVPGKDRLVWRQGAISRKAVKSLLQVF
jgi:hypothetical protein